MSDKETTDRRVNPAKATVRAALEDGHLRYWLEGKLKADALDWLLDAVAKQALTPRRYREKRSSHR